MPLAHTANTMLLPDSDIPETLKLVLSAVFGAGGVAFLRTWLENRRLGKKEFRETLLDRVRELEKIIAHMQVRMGNLRVEMAHLETENAALRKNAGMPPREDQHADQQPDTGDNDDQPS